MCISCFDLGEHKYTMPCYQKLKETFGEQIVSLEKKLGELTLVVHAKDVHAVLLRLHEDQKFSFEQLTDLCGLDYLTYGSDVSDEGMYFSSDASAPCAARPYRFAVVYHLLSISNAVRLRVRVFAEDDAMQASAIRQRLQKEGMTVDHASNGQEVLGTMHSKPYSLFILDVNMPKVDGFEVLQKIRNDPVTMYIPVIMLTAMGSENDIIKAYDLGANDYILKPFSAIQLVARVKSLLKKSK